MKIPIRKKTFLKSIAFVFISASLVLASWDYILAKRDPDFFGVYYATLDGKNMKLIVGDSYREMNHARVSPDKKWVTFTRFNKKAWNGLATEGKSGYDTTEIMIVRLDGSELQSLVPPRKGIVAANSYWTPDGKALLYISNDNPKKITQINKIDLATRKITTLRTPKNTWVLDPQQVGDLVVFPAVDSTANKNVLWTMRPDGSQAKRFTNPDFSALSKRKKLKYRLGDFDPKISPDGTRIAFMRQLARDDWRIFVKDIASGEEKDLSRAKTIDAMPEWSSDSKLLVFWHINKKELKKMGIYTIKVDGSGRKRIPLPRGYFYTMPAFFPGEGSNENTRIIFSAKKVPGL